MNCIAFAHFSLDNFCITFSVHFCSLLCTSKNDNCVQYHFCSLGRAPKQYSTFSVVSNKESRISQQPRWWKLKTHRIRTWGAAPCSNPMSFGLLPQWLPRKIVKTPKSSVFPFICGWVKQWVHGARRGVRAVILKKLS